MLGSEVGLCEAKLCAPQHVARCTQRWGTAFFLCVASCVDAWIETVSNVKSTIRCKAPGHEKFHPMLAIVAEDALYLLCSERRCRRWTRLRFSVAGRPVRLGRMGLVMELMPAGYHFDLAGEAPVVVGEDGQHKP